MGQPTQTLSKGKFPLSYSRMNNFKTCPAQFEHLYLTKDVVFQSSDAMDYGKRVHKQLELYGKTGDVSQLTRETLRWKGLVDRIRKVRGDIDYEMAVGLTEDLKKCGWFANDIWLRAILDVLVVDGDTAYALDYKTGKVRDDLTQLQFFACIVMFLYPQVNTVNTAFLWLVHDKDTTVVYTREHLEPLWGKLCKQLDVIQEAITLGIFVAKPSPLCNWCAAKAICQYKR